MINELNKQVSDSTLDSFDLIQIKIASPEVVKSWSFGEVKKAETINYRTLAPERDGLFCQKIFGPVKDWECACGKYKRIRYRGIVCEVCGVEVTESRVRRYRMGNIALAAPVVHIWYLKGIPSYLSLLLEVPLRDLEQVVYFNSYLVIDPGNTDLKQGQLLSEDDYDELVLKGDAEFEADMGADAILKLLNRLTRVEYEFPSNTRQAKGKVLAMPGLEELVETLRTDLKQNKSSAQKRVKLIKRLRLVDKLLGSKIDPAWIVMDILPVLPPDLRPMVQLDGGRFATSDLNDLYRRVINRNNRLIKLKEMHAPEIIIRNEKRMLQESVDALIDNGRRGREVVGTNGRRLKSLSDIIEGKQGRFRQNLLGKRVDYSGRSVIVVGPNLKLHQCGVPAPILLELFKPFIIEKLIKKGLAPNIKTAKKMIESGLTVVWETLEESIKDHPVLLNRAPTLHRLGIQAFEPVLVEGRAIQLHPLVCSSFNADFDGDQMAIHVPLSVEAQTEARMLMLASNNVLLPATGQPSIVPSQDMILGLYYLTVDRPNADNPEECRGAGRVFAFLDDARAAFESGLLHIHSKIKVRVNKGEIIETTPGRVIVNQTIQSVLSQVNPKNDFAFVNKQLNKKALSSLLIEVYEQYGTSSTAELANLLKDIGFHYSTLAGITIGIIDLDVPKSKKQLINDAEEQIKEAKTLFDRGDITEVERYNRVIDTWSETTEKLTESVVDNFYKLNPVYMMAFSGARGNISQVRQLVGMRGLMADSQGKIIDQPIKSNFKEGLTVTEYIISSYGARKGIVDTALKTADSGYLTRRLVDVAQDVIVQIPDCGTERSITLSAIQDRSKDVLPLVKRLFSRTVAEDIKDPSTGEIICERNQIIDRELADKICQAGVLEVKVRSPLTCESKRGICEKCYGGSLATNKSVPVGEAIGIIAAQSIGEPGTQLTMRTFHTGGAVAGSGSRKGVKPSEKGILTYDEQLTKETRTKYGEIVQQTSKDVLLKVGNFEFQAPSGSLIKFRSGQEVDTNQVIVEYSESTTKPLTEKAFKDVLTTSSGQAIFDGFEVDEKQDRFGNISRTSNQSGTIWVMEGQVYSLPGGSDIIVEDGQQIEAGAILSETSTYCEHAGEVRFSPEIEIEEGKDKDGNPLNKLIKGKDINIVIASVEPTNSTVEQTQQGNYCWTINQDEKYVLKVQPNEVVEDGMLLAELVSEKQQKVTCSGEIRYSDNFEVDEKRILDPSKSGTIYFIPEEIHSISKDISLKNVENGERVISGQELVKDVITRIDGIVELKVENDIIYEVIVRPGELHTIEDPEDLKVEDEAIIDKGVEVLPGVKTKEKSLISLIADDESGQVQVFIRPVQEFTIEPPKLDLDIKSSSEDMKIVPVTQILYKDKDRVRSLEGGQLTRTSLLLQMDNELKMLKGRLEFKEENLAVLVQDTILLRRESDSSITYLMVDNNSPIKSGDSIAKTQVLGGSAGEVRLSPNDERKLLLITKDHLYIQESEHAASLKSGDYLRKGDSIDGSSDTFECSGQVVLTQGNNIIIRRGRPYLISTGTQLHIDSGSLIQRGDQLATLIFEQQKTGDIVQGLPKVEELLEGRKPKEPAVLSPADGSVRIDSNGTDFKLLIQSETNLFEVEIPPGQNLIVEDGEKIRLGDPITDGIVNPHQVMEVLGQQAVQTHLINEVQQVYCSQGVDISDKHIEVIVRQMTMKVKIEDPGDSTFLPGELIEFAEVERENVKLESDGAELATYKHILLGITKASLNTKSFISAASFQETTRILAESSLEGKADELNGLKENVIVGKLIPAGTGYAHELRKQKALKESDLISAEIQPYSYESAPTAAN
ncbi:MAG: DNA-directed RNA polymerase subunit beta' [Candidatus Caenarcaniphilales bacterium]|nr:DNA-directed RNA polymerase subunit beta' [Candidatus Caenarcaniphilales bacterium]